MLAEAVLHYAPLVRPYQVVEYPHLKASGGLAPMQTEDGGLTEVVLLPLLMGGERLGVRSPLSKVGEHTDEILAQLAKT